MATRRILQPTARQVRLGSILRGLREEGAHGSQGSVAGELDWSESKLSRIESGRLGIGVEDLDVLLGRYGVKDQGLRTYVADLRRRGNVRGWETDIRSVVSAMYADYIGYESDASDAYNAQTTLIPGLLQTHDYAAAVISQLVPEMDEEEKYERLAIRDKRQQVFDRPNPLVFWGVISESVFRHPVGGPAVMAAQFEHLLTLAKEYPGTINIHVLPESSASHAALFGPFVVLSFPEQWEPDIVYLEGLTGTRFLEEPGEVRAYSRVFNRLMMSESLRGADSLKLIESHLKNYRKG
ncbi:helix-turn-helix transcriptional regulator [Streptomyces sp. ME02-8801-2C]|uniref:helix-turn-helix domain-containing protein n=1 Tax=Streptomyces sp. ME02-8801-2C TaxID=3028680 RepID=UPI0029BC29FB|nr:helix-turn-helix transcriptional regulator [Streptomyces sp. ME02-8801-2C]MDX3455522.1 helix-turn-helix transcriptional regulator [Streptomyces sp. ME02-8801-2C]